MNTKKLIKDLSANTVQIGITQLAGLIIFYLMSRYVSKNDFGEYGWATAIGITIISIGSLGLDLILVKRIAAGQNPKLMASVHFLHTVIMALVILPSLLLLQVLWPDFTHYHPIFMLVVLQLTLTNIANSFKFSLSGLSAFKQLAIVSVGFNIFKLLLIAGLLFAHLFSIKNIVIGFIIAALVEILLSYLYISKHFNTALKPQYSKTSYKDFIKEALPQLAIVLFDSALARFDWILLGIFSTASITAEYSFAFRFFELMKMPLLILAPILFTRFSTLFQNEQAILSDKRNAIQQFFNFELFVAFLIPIFMVCAWSDAIDMITDNKYGAINELTFTILAICVPLQFVINFYWTMGVIQGQLKSIMFIIIGTSLLNIIGNIMLIPKFGAEGAAVAYLLSSIAQSVLYFVIVKQERMRIHCKNLFLYMAVATIAVVSSNHFFTNSYVTAIIASTLYIVVVLLSKTFSFAILSGAHKLEQ